MNERKAGIRESKADWLLAILAAVLITTFAVAEKQSFLKTLPTLITLAVQMLMVRANRWAFFVGGLNSVLYGISYYGEGLYFSALFAVAVSFPIMLFSYFNWKKNEKNHTPELLSLKNGARVVLGIALVVSWVLCATFFGSVVSSGRFVWLDCFCFVAGLTVTLLAAWRYADAQYLNILSALVTLVMWIVICTENPKNINFVIISAYNLYKIVQTAINWTKFSRQKPEAK